MLNSIIQFALRNRMLELAAALAVMVVGAIVAESLPIDVLPDGRANMCDGCPDMTAWNGRLAWSCRLEECIQYGDFVRSVRKNVLSH